MNENLDTEMEKEKDQAFVMMRDILLNLGGDKIDGFERARHVLDILEELSARVIASCAPDKNKIDELCSVFSQNLLLLSQRFLAEDKSQV